MFDASGVRGLLAACLPRVYQWFMSSVLAGNGKPLVFLAHPASVGYCILRVFDAATELSGFSPNLVFMVSSSKRTAGGRTASSRASKVAYVRRPGAGGRFAGFIGAVAMSVVAGILLTAGVAPVVAMTGQAATTAMTVFENLPNHLNPGKLAQPSVLIGVDNNGDSYEIATFYHQDRQSRGWDDISQYVKDAVVAIEDPRFYTHGGVDVLATSRAAVQNLAGRDLSGASTITMQYVRNVLVQAAMAHPDEKEQKKAYEQAVRQDVDRKIKEMRYAIGIEQKYSKDEILLGYLNIALFGRRIYGIESAANYFYGVTAKDLSLAQSASLMGMVNSPDNLRIDDPEKIPANKKRRDIILGKMLQHGKITKQQHDEAVASEVVPNITPRKAGCNAAEEKWGLGHFCDYVLRTIQNDPKFGKSAAEREFNLSRGGYRITTTIDLEMQQAGTAKMREQVPATKRGIDPGGSVVSVEVGTGRVLTMVQNKAFNNDPTVLEQSGGALTSINYGTDYELGGSAGFQVGSTFKPMVLAEWIRSGRSVNEIVNVNGRTVDLSSFKASCVDGGVYGYGPFRFHNDNLGVRGNQTVRTAIAQSLNGGVVSMQQKLDLCKTFDLAESLGIHRASKQTIEGLPTFGTTKLTRVPANTFGGSDEIAPITMAAAYAAFAGGGKYCEPNPIDSIVDSEGKNVPFTKKPCRQGISAEVAAGVANVLQFSVTNGLAGHARSRHGIPHLAKTGTTDNIRDNWTLGASTRVATATWVGNAGPVEVSPGKFDRVPTNLFGLYYADQNIWPAVMNVADRKYGGSAFPAPSPTALRQVTVQVPDLKGKTVADAKALLKSLDFQVTDAGAVTSDAPIGTVASTNPAANASVPRGSSISLHTSSGQPVVQHTIPGNLVGQTGNAAKKVLNDTGYANVSFACDTGTQIDPAGQTVQNTDPGPGVNSAPENTVTLYLACSP